MANLAKYGFIEEAGTVREGRQPERTTYQITERGLAELRDWLAELLSVPEDERSGFVAALSEAGILPPDEVIGLLTTRLESLDKTNAAQQDDLKVWVERLPRVLLIESEYQLAMRVAQSQWLRGLLTELVEGTISGIDAWRRMHETGEIPPEFVELTSRREGGGTRRRQASMTARHSTTPVHGAGTPRTGVATSPPVPAVRQNPAIMRPNHDCMPGAFSRDWTTHDQSQ